jgi:hypothetical protein
MQLFENLKEKVMVGQACEGISFPNLGNACNRPHAIRRGCF